MRRTLERWCSGRSDCTSRIAAPETYSVRWLLITPTAFGAAETRSLVAMLPSMNSGSDRVAHHSSASCRSARSRSRFTASSAHCAIVNGCGSSPSHGAVSDVGSVVSVVSNPCDDTCVPQALGHERARDVEPRSAHGTLPGDHAPKDPLPHDGCNPPYTIGTPSQ